MANIIYDDVRQDLERKEECNLAPYAIRSKSAQRLYVVLIFVKLTEKNWVKIILNCITKSLFLYMKKMVKLQIWMRQ